MSRNPYLAASRPFTRSSRSSKRTDLNTKCSSLARSRSTTGLSSAYGGLGNSYSSAAGYTPTTTVSSSTAGWISSRPSTYDNPYSKQHSSSAKSISTSLEQDGDDATRPLSNQRYSREQERQSKYSYENPRSQSLSRGSSVLDSPGQSFDKDSLNDSNSVKFVEPRAYHIVHHSLPIVIN